MPELVREPRQRCRHIWYDDTTVFPWWFTIDGVGHAGRSTQVVLLLLAPNPTTCWRAEELEISDSATCPACTEHLLAAFMTTPTTVATG